MKHARCDVAADESAASVVDVLRVAETWAATVVNLKPMKSGFVAAHDAAIVARAHGLGFMIGATVESPLTLSASTSLAAGLGGFAFVDLDTHLWMVDPPVHGGFAQRGSVLDLSAMEADHGAVCAVWSCSELGLRESARECGPDDIRAVGPTKLWDAARAVGALYEQARGRTPHELEVAAVYVRTARSAEVEPGDARSVAGISRDAWYRLLARNPNTASWAQVQLKAIGGRPGNGVAGECATRTLGRCCGSRGMTNPCPEKRNKTVAEVEA